MDMPTGPMPLSNKGRVEPIEAEARPMPDLVASRLPSCYDLRGIKLRGAHKDVYAKLRASLMRASSRCADMGPPDHNGAFHCHLHIVASLIPPSPKTKVKFDGPDNPQPADSFPVGLSRITDPVLLPLISDTRNDGFGDSPGLVAHLAKLYGGDLAHDALRVNELETSENKFLEMKRRIDNIDVIWGWAPATRRADCVRWAAARTGASGSLLDRRLPPGAYCATAQTYWGGGPAAAHGQPQKAPSVTPQNRSAMLLLRWRWAACYRLSRLHPLPVRARRPLGRPIRCTL